MTDAVNDTRTFARPELIVVTAPSVDPISLSECKVQLRMESSDTSEDAYLTMLIKASVEWGEAYTRRAFIERTCRYVCNFFPLSDALEIPIAPVKTTGVSSVKYLVGGVLQTMPSAEWFVSQSARFSQICLHPGYSWPTGMDDQRQNVQIDFTAGYGAAASDVPSGIRMALLQFVAWAYTNRGDCDISNPPTNLARALSPYKLYQLT